MGVPLMARIWSPSCSASVRSPTPPGLRTSMKMGQPRSAPPVRAGEGEGEGEGEEGEGGTSREEMGGKEGEQKTQCHIRALSGKDCEKSAAVAEDTFELLITSTLLLSVHITLCGWPMHFCWLSMCILPGLVQRALCSG